MWKKNQKNISARVVFQDTRLQKSFRKSKGSLIIADKGYKNMSG